MSGVANKERAMEASCPKCGKPVQPFALQCPKHQAELERWLRKPNKFESTRPYERRVVWASTEAQAVAKAGEWARKAGRLTVRELVRSMGLAKFELLSL